MARYLVTGGAGFIGSNLTDYLLARGAQVRVLDDFSTGRESNLAHLEGGADFSLIRGDINDPEAVAKAVEGCEVIFHQAALGSVARSVEDPAKTNRSNVDGSIAILDAARRAGVRRVVMASSSSVYGDSEALPKREDQPLTPVSPYAASKAAMELYASAFTACYELEVVCLRYFNVYGPRQDPKSLYAAVVPAFVSALLSGTAGTIYGDGKQSRDFTYVGDVARANYLAATAPAEKANGGVFNIGGGERIDLLALYETIAKACGREGLAATFEDPRPGDVRHTLADISAAKAGIGWEPEVELAEGLEKTVAFFREQQ